MYLLKSPIPKRVKQQTNHLALLIILEMRVHSRIEMEIINSPHSSLAGTAITQQLQCGKVYLTVHSKRIPRITNLRMNKKNWSRSCNPFNMK